MNDVPTLDDAPGHPDPRPVADGHPMSVSRRVARRFLLGRQGLWPGRRWQGLRGTANAMRTIGDLQLDPLQVVARAHDIALAGRVIGYRPDDWATLTYGRRRFFEAGGWLAVRPIEELPFYRVVMRRERDQPRIRRIADEHGAAIEEMRALLAAGRGVVNRDFAAGDRVRVDSYRARKDSGLALHYLWRTGEAMVARRERFERVYAAAGRVAPPRYLREAPDVVADDHLLRRHIGRQGLGRLSGVRWELMRDISPAELAAWRDRALAEGSLLEVEVEGLGRRLALGEDAPALESLARGRVPRAWRPLEATTADEVTLLSPLEPAIHDRNRTRALFHFDYLWEVYTPAHKRAFGYYALPILWGDRLAGRTDLRLDRSANALVVKGLWLEEPAVADDRGFAAALAAGMERFRDFVGAERIEAPGIETLHRLTG
ncbi:MAG TPA: crosslink repair DNA glycosylase YcaQ family protein [Candidatus Limnocylindrales bacterium]